MISDEAIVISVPEGYPSELFSYIETDLHRSNFKVKTLIIEREPMAGIEWALPTAVLAYLLKPFFEAFLQEAGKDFYELTKTKIKRFIKENREVKTRLIAASASTEKLSRKYDQSNTISVKARIHSELVITVLFNENIPDEETDQMLEGLFQLLNFLYVEYQKQKPEEKANLRGGNEVFLLANPSTRQWEILTNEQMIEKYRNV